MKRGRTERLGRLRPGAVVLLLAAGLSLPLQAASYDLTLIPGEPTAVFDTGDSILAGDADGDLLRAPSPSDPFSVVHAGDPGDAVLAMDGFGETVIAVGQSGVILRSVDEGWTWTEKGLGEAAILGEWRGVATDGEGRWVAVGVHQDQCAALISVDDGLTWELVDPDIEGHFNGIVWEPADERFVAVGGDGFFEGLAFSSENGASWVAMEFPDTPAPLYFVASDGAGGLLMGGENGLNGSLLMRDGTGAEFEFVQGNAVSEPLHAAVAAGPGEWIVGGANTLLISVRAESDLEILGPPVPGGPTIGGLLFRAPGTLLVTGGLPEIGTPDEPEATLSIQREEGTGHLVLTLEGAVVDRSYRLETSVDLVEWTLLAGSERLAFGSVVEWILTPHPEEGKRFWRAVGDFE